MGQCGDNFMADSPRIRKNSPSPKPGEIGEQSPDSPETRWRNHVLIPSLEKSPERPIGSASGINLDGQGRARFTTVSGAPVERLYTEASLPATWTLLSAAGPGEPPYTRGIHPTGYRGRLWSMRQFSGFASPEETNLRYKYLLANGGTGLSVAFDLPTLMGCDSDDPQSEGEVGKCGVAIDSLEDMETLFSGIDLEKISVSMTINSPAHRSLGDVSGGRREAGRRLGHALNGTLQNDILKEYIAQKEYLYPPRPSMRLVVDAIEFGAKSRRASIPFPSPAITSAKRDRQQCRSWPSLSMTALSTWSGPSGGVCELTTSPRG